MGDHGYDERRYAGCWGWYQAGKNKEYAIAGTSNGTYFIDITAPATPTVCGFVQASQGCTYREIKTYQNYCYIISDDGMPNGLQIVDLQYLPDSLPVIYNGTKYFNRAHSIWIDGSKMYLGSVTFSNSYASMAVYSLATPTAPLLLRTLTQDYPFVSIVHDMHVNNDTVYASCATQGLYVFKFDPSAGFQQIGSYTGYTGAGYNHSSILTSDGKHLLFTDEVPSGLPIHLVNIENPGNIQKVRDFLPHNRTTPHNSFVREKFAIVSCYEDGLYVYDISDPGSPSRVGYFDTHPQGGANTGTYAAVSFRGNWGVYPHLPSKLIIANDMQNGVFILDAAAAYTTSVKDPVNVDPELNSSLKVRVFPNPAFEELRVETPAEHCMISITDLSGRILDVPQTQNQTETLLRTGHLAEGLYFITARSVKGIFTKKIIIRKK